MIVAKGKKVSECQFNPNWHTSAPRSVASACDWLQQLWDQDGRRLGVPAEFPRVLGEAIEVVPARHANPDAISEKQA